MSAGAVGDRRAQMMLLTLAASAAAFARASLGPLQESMRLSLALEDNQMALLQGLALALPVVLTALPMGLLIDRTSRVRLLSCLAVVDVIGGFMTAAATSFSGLFIARCLVGFAAMTTTTAAFSILADLYPASARGRASTIVVVGQYGGIAAAFALGGLALGAFTPSSDAWRWAVASLSAPLVLVVLCLFAMREPARTGAVLRNPSLRQARAELWRTRSNVGPLLLAILAVEIALQAAFVWAGPALTRRFALSAERLGAIMALVMLLSGVIGPIAGGLLADWCQRAGGPRRTFGVLSGLTAAVLPTSLFAIVPSVALAGAALVAFMTAIGAILVAGVTALTIVVPNELRGLCISASAAANVLFGIGAAPLIVSVLAQLLGGAARMGMALAVVSVVATAFGAASFALASHLYIREAPR